ncbi:GTPase HflX [Companilactobacillus pabuli]|jgi:GTP-binding protein HflX|uniref:GTPase HflX n=1 Tax=Companilactobacillus pabuli TaxID=2714036 RepID=A0A7L7L0F0_9LACO|nr:GTPase HflX [Companilactobacillus pabuli]AKP02924.1 GTP-binding protein [Companilactobacillus farciminis]AKS51224.1 GTP-binding protein [Companilactobacillus farciminis]MDG5111996.1 GTPase HflX [Companilactobacillus pabuli]QMT85112.1 GTPase HflX [Companilactobacillus pabuli]
MKESNLTFEKTRVIVAGVSHLQADFEYTMQELASLVEANNMEVADTIIQNADTVSGATYFGSGKVHEIKEIANADDVQIVVLNDELTPSQIRNLEKETKLSFMDRTELILQVFSTRAQTKQAKLQVEIAKLQYQLPRIHPSGNPLDQQSASGGLANRGAGESKLELDRRVIRKRITALRNELKTVDKTINVQSRRRTNTSLPLVSLVGYTNAGKSTTMNGLLNFNKEDSQDRKVFEKNMLFATLDTSVRRIDLEDNTSFLLSDTVGFVSKLPHNLVESFKTTLKEAQAADLLIQVIDVSDEHWKNMIDVTEKTLKEIGVTDKPMIYAFNKADLKKGQQFPTIEGDNIYYSALDKESIEKLVDLIKLKIFNNYQKADLLVPYSDQKITEEILQNSQVLKKEFTNDGSLITANLSPTELEKFNKYIKTEMSE